MPGPQLNALKQAMQARQEAQQAASGGLPMPNPTPQSPTPLGGLQAAAPVAAPQMQMNPAERSQFTQDTGIAPNPAAGDIHLPQSVDDLLKRAYALTGMK